MRLPEQKRRARILARGLGTQLQTPLHALLPQIAIRTATIAGRYARTDFPRTPESRRGDRRQNRKMVSICQARYVG